MNALNKNRYALEIDMTVNATYEGPNGLEIEHPLFDSNTVMLTPPITEMFNAVRKLMLLRETNCCFTAPSGAGKTRALRMLEYLLTQRMPNLTIYLHNIQNHQTPSIRGFFKHFLTTVGHADKKGETYDLRSRLSHRLTDSARERASRRVVLLIDEGNAMTLQDFQFLKDVGNDLDKEGVQLVTIMMGQDPEFSEVMNRLRDEKKLDLVGRFTRRPIPFRSYTSRDDIVEIFRQIDESHYPVDSGISWAQFFLASAWEDGFRMENQVDGFLHAGEHCFHDDVSRVGYPAKQLFGAVRFFMVAAADLLATGAKLDSAACSNAWSEAIDFALLESAVGDINAQKVKVRRRVRR